MKKIILITVLAVLCLGAVLPPALPSSFWGITNLREGQKIDVYVDGLKISTVRTIAYEGVVYYTVNVPGELSGKIAVFKVKREVLAEHILASGTNVRVDLVR